MPLASPPMPSAFSELTLANVVIDAPVAKPNKAPPITAAMRRAVTLM